MFRNWTFHLPKCHQQRTGMLANVSSGMPHAAPPAFHFTMPAPGERASEGLPATVNASNGTSTATNGTGQTKRPLQGPGLSKSQAPSQNRLYLTHFPQCSVSTSILHTDLTVVDPPLTTIDITEHDRNPLGIMYERPDQEPVAQDVARANICGCRHQQTQVHWYRRKKSGARITRRHSRWSTRRGQAGLKCSACFRRAG